ncbi:hypothetical protein BKA65DRAFT_77638 [Rhexocercosporidium sp. MPI-PUGE-AT-0058]|nr:hypothetical protein BKA65DRAFT_77638 [Rhexocercosporidium sp. MPI-PUGE-AT-0058]
MADPVGTHAELILSTAKLGEELSVNLLKFASRYNLNQLVMLNLSTATGLISGNLQNLSETIEKFGPKIDLEDGTTKPLVAGLRAIFEKVKKALEEGVQAENEHGDDYDDTEDPNGVPQRRYNTRKIANNHAGTLAFTRVLGGYTQAEMLVWHLEAQKCHVFFLAKGIRYLALKKMEEEDNLDGEQKSALKKLVRELPQLMNELLCRQPMLQALAAKWKAGEDLTYTQRRRNSQDIYIIPRERDVDFDARSISSVGSVVSDVYIDTKEIYETWLIRKGDGYVRRAEHHWSFLGLQVHESYDNDNWNADMIPCSQDELKSKYELSKTGEGSDIFRKKINSLPAGVHREIEFLLQERIRNSKAPKLIRTWTLIDATPTSPLIPRQQPRGWFGWFKGEPEVLDWKVVLKAESSAADGMDWPNGGGDPFRKNRIETFSNRRRVPDYRERREMSPEREIVIDQRRDTRYSRHVERVEPRQPTPEEAHNKIKEIITEIGVFAKDSAGENPLEPVAGVSS